MANLHPLTLQHRDLFRERLALHPPEISEHTFTNLFIWQGARPIEFLEADGGLILFEHLRDGRNVLGPPIGDIAPDRLMAIAREAAGAADVALARLPEGYALSARAAGFEVAEDRDNFDYVYRREELAELGGRHFHGKRNLIAQCLSEYDCIYEEIAPAGVNDVAQMMDRWCARRGCGQDPGLCEEYLAVQELFAHYGELPVIGAAIRIEGKIAAFTVGEALSPSTAVVHFEKAMPEFKGLYQVMNQWFAKNHLAQFAFVNREQDLGIEGLRKAKESYAPDHLVKKYSVGRAAKVRLSRCTP